MSTELIISTGNTMPDYLKEVGYVDEGLADGIAIRSPKLSVTTAKEFTITKGGVTQILDQRSIRCVLVASSQTLTKAWYEKAFTPGSNEAPDCFSNDGKVPAPGVAKPQHANCAGCPKNAFGSHPTTGRGKACGDRKLVVVVWEGDPDTLMTFNAPTMTLSNLAKLNSELKAANVPLQSVLVEFSFDPQITYPVVKLSAVGFVDKASLLRFKQLADSDEVKSMLREVDYEPAAEAAPSVPQNTIQFGSASATAAVETAVETSKAVDPAAAQIAALQAQLAALEAAKKPAGPTPEELAAQQLAALQAQLAEKQRLEAAEAKKKADAEAAIRAEEEKKRKEAEALAAAAAKPKTEAELLQEQIAALQAQLAGGAATTTAQTAEINLSSESAASASASEPAKRRRRTKAEMEAARATAAAGGEPVVETAEEQEDAAAETAAADTAIQGTVVDEAPTGSAGAPDIMSLLAKWQK